MDFTIPDNPEFSLQLRQLERTDPAAAELFNMLFLQLLQNDAALKKIIDLLGLQKGTAGGFAELDSAGKVPSSQLPSFVDDVLEGYFYNGGFYQDSSHASPVTGEAGKIYIDLVTNKTYRWSGSAFIVISDTLALGETSSAAYRGDRGKTAYEHAQKKSGNPHGVTKSDVGLGNVPNVSTNDQAPTYTVASADAELASGEKLSTAFGKIAKVVKSLIAHIADTARHVSSTEKTYWNDKLNNTGGTVIGSVTVKAAESAPATEIGTSCSLSGGAMTTNAGSPVSIKYGIAITSQSGALPCTIDGNRIVHAGNVRNYAPSSESGTCSFMYSGTTIMTGVYRKIGNLVFVAANGNVSLTIPSWSSITGMPYPLLSQGNIADAPIMARLQLSPGMYDGEEGYIAKVAGSGFLTSKEIQKSDGLAMYLTMIYITS